MLRAIHLWRRCCIGKGGEKDGRREENKELGRNEVKEVREEGRKEGGK